VMERNAARVALSDGVLQTARAGEEEQRSNAARETGVRRGHTTAFQAVPTTRHWQSRVDPLTDAIRRNSPLRRIPLTQC